MTLTVAVVACPEVTSITIDQGDIYGTLHLTGAITYTLWDGDPLTVTARDSNGNLVSD